MTPVDPHLEAAFGKGAPEHLSFQTQTPYVSDRERELVRSAFLPLGERVLDLGCAEGATLIHLGARDAGASSSPQRTSFTGIDLFPEALTIARRELPGCTFVAGSAEALPFADGSFDHVLIRDVIHHLDDPAITLSEVARVLAPGGRVDVLEPCRYNPLIALHAITQRAERGELRSTPGYLTGILSPRFRVASVTRHQAFPIHRLVFHPKLGSPRAAENERVRALVGAFESLAERLLPQAAWAYIHVRAQRA